MFEMVNEGKTEPRDRKVLLEKIGLFLAAFIVLAGVVYVFAFYSAH
ncbi:MAG: hypothetical protein ABSH52_20130 [Terriglobia bacterium]|jgi:cell division septal protein FtsQ